ncbi:MAG: glycerol-3-phosphate acyltransferase [Acidimicrobiia bacterium]|nr:glycerol-3-phosphate acyltransferase [Acidimicrobiia bacterium]
MYGLGVDLGWVAVVPAYLLGTLPTALVVGRGYGRDLTTEGSGNPGASNAWRTLGRRAAAVVLLGDVGKGALAAGMGWAIGGRALGVGCALAAVVGHVAPVRRGFRGGKGVATMVGAALVLLPVVMVVLGLAWALIVRISGVAAAGSLVVAAGLPVGAALIGQSPAEVAMWAAAGVVVVTRHRDNIGRLRRGEEPSLSD